MTPSKLAGIAFLAYAASRKGNATQVITNGGFETNGLSSWTVTNEAGSYAGDSFYALSSKTTPQSGSTTVGAESGMFYAVSDGNDSGASALTQSFVVPGNAASVILSFGLFVNSADGNGTSIDPGDDLNFSGAANQYGLVSLLSAGANTFATTSATGDLKNFYQGTDSGAVPNNYTNYSFDITSLVSGGGTFTIRFAEVNNVDVLNLGVDNVSVVVTPKTTVPEPASAMEALVGFATFGLLLKRARGHRITRLT